MRAFAQVWGELARRWLHMREYQGYRSTADTYLLCDSLQRRGPPTTSSAAAGGATTTFPRHGYMERGKYYGVPNCGGNLVKVCFNRLFTSAVYKAVCAASVKLHFAWQHRLCANA